MNPSMTMPDEVREYVEQVRAALADLRADEREELLADVEISVLETHEEYSGPLSDRLGTPERFANDLRAAAGLSAARPVAGSSPTGSSGQLAARLRAAAGHPATAATLKAGRELAPAWWVARGFLVFSVIGFLAAGSVLLGTVPLIGGPVFTFMALIVVVLASIIAGMVGRRASGATRAVLIVVNVALLLFALPFAERSIRYLTGYPVVEVTAEEYVEVPVFTYQGSPVTNVYAYSREGELLQDVRLYDQNGNPLDLATERGMDPDRRRVFDVRGDEAANAFPIRYREPGTKRVADPEAGAPKAPRPLKTPPLRAEP